MESLFQDVRYAIRLLIKSPAFTLVAVLTLALGIGANTAIFSLINALLLKTLPVRNPAELVVVGDPARANDRNLGTPQADLFSYPLYRELRDGNNVFAGMMASGEVNRTKVETAGSGLVTEDAVVVLVTGNYFSVLGVDAVKGRALSPEDDTAKAAHPVAVVSYDFWQRKLSADRNIIGQAVRLNNYPYTVVGVAAPAFFGDTVGNRQDFWVPIAMQEQMMPGRPWLDTIEASWLRVIARLQPGVTTAQAEANLNVVFQQWVKSPRVLALDPGDQDFLKRSKLPVVPGGQGFSRVRGEFSTPLLALMGIVGLVLLIACVNVANLLLARATARRRELAVRLAIGASRTRLVRQLLTESLVLAFAGGAAGLIVARWGTEGLLKLTLDARASDVLQSAAPDARVLAFTAGICLLTGLVFGLVPAFRSARVAVSATLKEGALSQAHAGRFPVGKVLVVVQIAICLLVLFAAGLLVRSLNNLKTLDLGYDRKHVLMARADPVAAGYSSARQLAFQQEMVSRLAALPGVRSVTASQNGLFAGTESASGMKIEGYVASKDQDKIVYWDQVGANYFHSLGIPILLGRDFGPQDTPTSLKVAVINETMARFYFGKANPIGRKIWIDDQEHKDLPIEIVGVARDVRDHTLRGQIRRRFYVPVGQGLDPKFAVNFEIIASGDPEALTESVRKAFTAFDASIPLARIRSLDEMVDSSISRDILVSRLSACFAALALLLACVGLYGIMSYSVGGRTREIGVRMAIGAQRGDVLWMVLREAVQMIAIGLIVGVPLALAVGHLLSSMLFGLKATDPLSMFLVVAVLAVIAMLAGWIPARRATRVDPMVALRYE